jgi:O-antigen/teichoic acid export membrane protein
MGQPLMPGSESPIRMERDDTIPGEAKRVPALGHVVARGMTWMVAATVLAKAASLMAQIVLGWKLSQGDFALFSTAMAVASFTTVCRGMGVRELIVQRGREGYADLSGCGFWLALAYNTLIAAVIAALAWPVSLRFFGSDQLPKLLWVMALALPIGTPSGILRVKLRVDLRFRAHTGVTTAAALIRQLSTIVFALMGFGVMSMALPVLVMAVAESAAAAIVTRDAPWRRSPEFQRWPGLAKQTAWPMISSVAAISLDWGPFLVLGRVMGADNGALGLFGFAYNITAQVGMLLSENGIQVLVPALVRLREEPQRQIKAALRALRLLMLVGSIASVGLATVMAPLEHLLWHGKWAAAVPAVVVLGVFFCWKMTLAVTSAILHAQGHFKKYSILTLLEGVGVSMCAWAAVGGASSIATLMGMGEGEEAVATDIAAWVGVCVLVSRVAITLWVFVGNGASAREVLGAVVPAWLIALAAGTAGVLLERSVDMSGVLERLIGPRAGQVMSGAIPDVARTLLAGAVCAGVFFILARLLLGPQLRDSLLAVPPQLRGRVGRLMLLAR